MCRRGGRILCELSFYAFRSSLRTLCGLYRVDRREEPDGGDVLFVSCSFDLLVDRFGFLLSPFVISPAPAWSGSSLRTLCGL